MTAPVLSYGQKAGVRVDLDVLVRSRMLIQANSGGGKSWALRQLLEETFGRVQHLVLDPEGEYHTLREEFDYVLAAKHGGDVEATPRTAKVLCRRLMETSASAVLDLYDLKIHERREFVRLFLTELMGLPKDLRRPLLVVLDEAHAFAPEGGKSEALEAVMTLASQGRKRGYALIAATQRLSKLSKDVAAECLTRMIGRTGLDRDVKRAGDELGMDKEARAKLPMLEPGHFYVFGPAIVPAGPPRLVQTGRVKTSHPQPGAIEAPTPAPSAKVKKLLAESLKDLPQQAAEEARTVAELQKLNTTLKQQLTRMAHTAVDVASLKTRVVEKPVVDQKAIDRAVRAAVAEAVRPWAKFERDIMRVMHGCGTHARSLANLLAGAPAPPTRTTVDSRVDVQVGHREHGTGANHPTVSAVRQQSRSTTRATATSDNGALPKGERIVLTAIAQHGDEGVTREQLTVLTGYKRSTRDAYIQRMSQSGLVNVEDNGSITATSAGIAALGDDYQPLPTGDELYQHWTNDGRLPEGERKILELVHEVYPQSASRDWLSEETGYARSSRDAYIQRLSARKLITTTREGVRMSDTLHG